MTQSFPQKYQVPSLKSPERLDQFLIRLFPTTSRNFWRAHLKALVRVDEKAGRKGQRLDGGEIVEVLEDPCATQRLIPNPDLEIPILYEDFELIAVDKPAGLPCHPLGRDEINTVANGVAARFPETASLRKNSLEGGLLHRLDNETSGVLLICRSEAGLRRFQALNRAGGILKYYLAWVAGRPKSPGTIDLPISHHSRKAKKMLIPADEKRGRPALTQYRRIKEGEGNSLLLVRIHKGARHQIRLHLSHLGHPVLGDKLYGTTSDALLERHLLHARRVEFKHPFLKKKITITAPLPRDFLAY